MAVLQIVRFRTNPGVEVAEMEALNERFQREVVPTLPGLERREACRTDDGEWVLVLRYPDMDHAKGGNAPTPSAGHGVHDKDRYEFYVKASFQSFRSNPRESQKPRSQTPGLLALLLT